MEMKTIPTSEPDAEAVSDTLVPKPGSISKSTSYSNLNAEKVLQGFGTFGAYQMFICVIVNVGFFLYAAEVMIFSLILKKPEFTCNQPREHNTTLGQCEYFDSEINSTIKCSSFSYTEGKQAYVTSEFDLVCDDAHSADHNLFLYMLGAMLSCPILTQLSDLYGRRIMYLTLLWLSILGIIGCAFTPSYILFSLFIFTTGIGVNGIGMIRYVLILESVAPAFRSYNFLISVIVWTIGYTVAGIIHMCIESWRWQLFALVTPLALTFSYYWLVPESIHWLIVHNKITEVERWIKTAEKFNRKKLDLEECKSSDSSVPDEEEPEKDHHKKTLIDVLSSGPMTFQLVSHCYIMIVMNFTYWALSFFSTELHENKMVGYFLSGFSELPTAGTTFFLNYFGRRSMTSSFFLAQAVAMCLAVFYPGKNLVSMMLFLLVRFLNNNLWISEPLLMGEMAPTSTRNIFCGMIGFVGKIGSITAPYFYRLEVIHKAAPAITMALLSVTAGLLALCSPETINVPMPKDIDEFDPGPVYPWIFGKSRKKNEDNAEISTVQQNSTPLLKNSTEDGTQS